MEPTDFCPHCLRSSCAGDAVTCPRRFDLVPQLAAQILAGRGQAAPPPVIVMCSYCGGQGGLRTACYLCGKVGA